MPKNTIKIYGLIKDCGDGSSCIDFFKDINIVNKLLKEDPESYYSNEGGPAIILNLPKNIDLKKAGITLEDNEFAEIFNENIFNNYDDLSDFLVDADLEEEYIFTYNNVKYKLENRLKFVMDYGIDTYWQSCNFKDLYDNNLIVEVE